MALIDELKWQVMTSVVNDIKSPNIFLKRMLYSNEQPQPVEDIRIETIAYGRNIAPFVRKNGEAVMVPGYDGTGYTVQAPNIRIKRPMTADQRLYNRPIGNSTIFLPTAQGVQAGVREVIARDAQTMEYMVSNAEEYLVAMSLQGQVSYVQADQDAFTITYPRSSSNNISLSVFLDDATPANIRLLGTITTIKQIVADDGSPALTDAICGSQAGAQLMALAEAGLFKWANTFNNNTVDAGTLSFVSQFSDDGALYLGTLAGIRFWMYSRTANLNGTSVSMIRPKYIEFVSTSPATERVMYYGAIPDMTALLGGLLQSKRFSKTWEQPDPSAIMSLVHSRPLPVPRRPNASVSVKVISG